MFQVVIRQGYEGFRHRWRVAILSEQQAFLGLGSKTLDVFGHSGTMVQNPGSIKCCTAQFTQADQYERSVKPERKKVAENGHSFS